MTPSIAELMQRFLANTITAPVAMDLVEPYDVATAFKVDTGLAWNETQLVLKLMGEPLLAAQPPQWAEHVRAQAPARFVPMAVGLFPQMASDFSLLTGEGERKDSWTVETHVPGSRFVAFNQSAAFAWVNGDTTSARKLWNDLPASPVRAFNLGMAAVAARDRICAQHELQTALSGLPTDSGWRALAELYLAFVSG